MVTQPGPAAAKTLAQYSRRTDPATQHLATQAAAEVECCDAQVDGATVVWDLKKQRPVITLKDPNRCATWGC